MAVADLNGDRLSDLVVGGEGGGPGETSVLLAGPGGRLSSPQPQLLSGSGGLAVADMNADGHTDVVRAARFFTDERDYGELTVLFGDGAGGFPTRRVTRTACCVDDLAAGDFNGDGNPDLAVLSDSSGSHILVGDGTGGFKRRRVQVGHGSPIEVAVAYLNRDRRPDILVLHGAEEPHDLTVQFGDGRGGFSRPRTLPGNPVTAFAVGRFNRDRRPDLATISSTQDSWRYYVRVFFGAAGGEFKRGGRFGIGRHRRGLIQQWRIAAADLNGDRKRDLAIGGPAGSVPRGAYTLRVLRGTGRGTFTRPRGLAHCCDGLGPLALGFFDGGRKPDLVGVSGRARTVPGGYHELVSVLINKTTR
jgi:hypothetical protein